MQKNTPDILKKIIKHKLIEVQTAKNNIPIDKIKKLAKNGDKTRNFYHTLQQKVNNKQNAIIAEIKQSSPSKGVLRVNFEPHKIARSYQNAGASCLSVLTDFNFFMGSNEHLQQVRDATNLPVLRKDFIIDKYQIYQSRAINADCVLLIAACLSDMQLQDFSTIAKSLNMDVLVEVHNEEELDRALQLDLKMIGINNRNLHSFETNLKTTLDLITKIENKLIITESGILTKADVQLMNNHNIYAFLVGEALMRKDNIEAGFRKLF